MKKSILAIFTMALLAVGFLTSCESDSLTDSVGQETLIQGTWSRTFSNGANDNLYIYSFNSDGSFVQSSVDWKNSNSNKYTKLSGRWAVSGNAVTITRTDYQTSYDSYTWTSQSYTQTSITYSFAVSGSALTLMASSNGALQVFAYGTEGSAPTDGSVAVPLINPPGGTYTATQTVIIGSASSGAVVHYTTDGTPPTASSSTYTGSISVSASKTINAIAVKNGISSGVASASYVIQHTTATVSAPSLSPVGGSYGSAQIVTLSSATSGASIYYTTDGSTPTVSSNVYTGPFTVSSTTTVRAIAILNGVSSTVTSATYTINVATIPSAPSISPTGGTYTSAQTVYLSSATSGASIYYTRDGSYPNTKSTKYTGAIVLSASDTIIAVAYLNGTYSSSYTYGRYIINIPVSTTIPWNTSITYGTLRDSRDTNVYKTVTIGTQTWMAENLNYWTDSSRCYGNSNDSCVKYGRLYTWADVMALPNSYNTTAWNGSDVKHQGICPAGWHIPSDAEWTTLTTYIGGESSAGTKLKSTNGWTSFGNGGTDAYGFRAIPGGNFYRTYSDSVGFYGYWWSSTENNAINAWLRFMNVYNTGMYRDRYLGKSYGFSLRCTKD